MLFRSRYNGFLGGRASDTVIEREGQEVLEVVLYATPPAEGSLTLVYLAPTLTRIYAVGEFPKLKNPFVFDGFNKPVRPKFFRNTNGIQIAGNTSTFLRLFDFKVQSSRTLFDPQPDGHVWRVTEVIKREIVQIAHVDAETFLGGLA